MNRAGRSIAMALCLLALAGCSFLPGSSGGIGGDPADAGVPYPAGCSKFGLSARRCEAIVDAIAAAYGVDPSAAAGILLLGDPGCGGDPKVLCTRSTSFVVRVRFLFPNRPALEDSQFCGIGGQYSLLCTDNPEVRLSSPTLDGFGDVPCTGEPPEGCATPVPGVDPAVAREAVPLRVAALDIPLDHDGAYDVPVGTAVLPNGILTDASFSLLDPHQAGFTLADGVIALVVLGDDGQPMWNAYAQGWRPGTEAVTVRLRFSVESHEPGVVIHVRDVVVQ